MKQVLILSPFYRQWIVFTEMFSNLPRYKFLLLSSTVSSGSRGATLPPLRTPWELNQFVHCLAFRYLQWEQAISAREIIRIEEAAEKPVVPVRSQMSLKMHPCSFYPMFRHQWCHLLICAVNTALEVRIVTSHLPALSMISPSGTPDSTLSKLWHQGC